MTSTSPATDEIPGPFEGVTWPGGAGWRASCSRRSRYSGPMNWRCSQSHEPLDLPGDPMIAERLALDGGQPVRADWLPFHRPTIEDDDVSEVVETLRSGWLTTGPRCKRFEEEVCSYLGTKHALALNSGTA